MLTNPKPAVEQLDLTTILVVLFGGVIASLAVMGIISILPAMQTRLAHSDLDRMLVKQMIGVVGLGMVVGSPLAGALIDRFGPKHVIGAAAAIYVVVGTAGLYLNDLPWLVASRFLLGIVGAGIEIVSLTIINTRIPAASRAKWMGIHLGVAMWSTLIIQPSAGALAELWWRGPFLLHLAALFILPYALFARDPSHTEEPVQPVAGRVATKELPVKTIAYFTLLAFLIGNIIYLTMIYTPFFLHHLGVERPFVISLILTADSIVGAAMAMCYGWARRFICARTCFAIGLMGAAIGTLVAGLAVNLPMFVVGLLTFGVGSGWLWPNLLTSLGDRIDTRQQGRAAGIVSAGIYLASPLSVIAAEPVAGQFGQSAAFMMAAAISCILFVLTVGGATFRTNVVASKT